MIRTLISNALWFVPRYCHSPSERHWNAVKPILEYLKYGMTEGLELGRTKGREFTLFADSDSGDDESHRHSVTGAALSV